MELLIKIVWWVYLMTLLRLALHIIKIIKQGVDSEQERFVSYLMACILSEAILFRYGHNNAWLTHLITPALFFFSVRAISNNLTAALFTAAIIILDYFIQDYSTLDSVITVISYGTIVVLIVVTGRGGVEFRTGLIIQSVVGAFTYPFMQISPIANVVFIMLNILSVILFIKSMGDLCKKEHRKSLLLYWQLSY
jgi:hypothetical protein